MLTKEEIQIYTSVFGNNNNANSRNAFYSDSLIRKLWNILADEMTFERCFRKISCVELFEANIDVYRNIRNEIVKLGLKLP